MNEIGASGVDCSYIRWVPTSTVAWTNGEAVGRP
jgi:hypothetical protein